MNKFITATGLIMFLLLFPLTFNLAFTSGSDILGWFSVLCCFGGIVVTAVGASMKGKSKPLPPSPTFNQAPPQRHMNNQLGVMQTPAVNYPISAPSAMAAISQEDVFSQIEKWGKLKEEGLITEEEFQRKKNELL